MASCERCGQELQDKALTCWACGQLTEAGRQARAAGGGDEDETWRRSVAAARQRQQERPVVDPEAVLRQVVAETGTEGERERVNRADLAHDDRRTEYPRLREAARAMSLLGLLLACVLLLAGMLLVVATVVLGQGEVSMIMAGVGAGVLFGGLGLGAYFMLRYWAEALAAVADAADNSRRSVLLLRDLIRQTTAKEGDE
jgi:hypothetical protein